MSNVDYSGGDGVAWSVEHQVGTRCTTVSLGAVTTGDRINIVVDADSNALFDLTALTGEIQLN